MKVLVCDGRSRAALQICRSLGRKGHEVHVGESFVCSSFYSNQVYKKFLYPDPDVNPNIFFDFVSEYIHKNKISFILPVRDSSTMVITQRQSEISAFCNYLLPNYTDLMIFQNKKKLIRIANKLKILVPKSFFPDIIVEEDYALYRKKFGPVFIIKPIYSSGSRGIELIRNKQNFLKFINSNPKFDDYIVQQFIPHGGAIGVYTIYNKGKLIEYNTHVRIREYPHSGGPSTFRRSGKNALCEKLAFRIMSSVKWNGPAMVEFRMHKKTKMPYFMEVNPRFWGSLAVDIHSGVDFPNIMINAKSNKNLKIKSIKKQKVYVRWLFLGDILWLLTHPKKMAAARSFLDFRNQKFDILDFSDPLPVLGALIDGLISLIKSNRRRHAFGRGWN